MEGDLITEWGAGFALTWGSAARRRDTLLNPHSLASVLVRGARAGIAAGRGGESIVSAALSAEIASAEAGESRRSAKRPPRRSSATRLA